MYKVNDYVVYKHDVCKIKGIKENTINQKTYYVMTPIDDDSLIISVPIENKTGYLRDIIKKDEAEELISNIPNISVIENINDKNIELKYRELLNNNTHEDLVKIIKTSYLRNKNRLDNNKKASEKDNNFFILAEKYLYNELSISLNKSTSDIKNYIFMKVNK